MSIIISILITFLVVILVLYLINMLPLDGRAKQIAQRGRHHHRHHLAAQVPRRVLSGQSGIRRSRSAFATTLTDDSAIAAAAMIGDSSRPKTG